MTMREFRASTQCCGKRRRCDKCPDYGERMARYERGLEMGLDMDPEDYVAWAGDTEDRLTYNLGDGCRRVMPYIKKE